MDRFLRAGEIASRRGAHLNAEINRALGEPDVKTRLSALRFEIQIRSQPDFAAYVQGEVEQWRQVIKATGINAN